MNKKKLFIVLALIVAYLYYNGIVSKPDNQLKAITHTLYNDWGQVDGDIVVPISENILAKSYYIILDTSGSMKEKKCVNNGTKMNAAKRSLAQWIDNVGASDNIALMTFNGEFAKELLPLRKNVPDYKTQFLDYVSDVKANGTTPLGDALNKAYNALEVQAQSQLGYGEYHIVVVTDGNATDGEDMDKATQNIFKSPVILHTIGFCITFDHALNQPDKAYYISAMDEVALKKGLDRVLAESESFDIQGFQGIK